MNARLEELLGQPVRSLRPVSGGCVADAALIELENGEQLFAKHLQGHQSPFPAEAACLQALAHAGGVRVPEVRMVHEEFLVLERLQHGPPAPDYMERFGRELATTHRTCAATWGFDLDHVIGTTPQTNTPRVPVVNMNWSEFWWRYRMEPMIAHVESKAGLNQSLRESLRHLESRLPDLIDHTGETASLLHGDLWSGNAMADETGSPVMFDPAGYHGHREADLSMTRMFGGFDERFYAAYDEAWPLVDGWRDRLDLYMLYHVLNHIPGFGSNYAAMAENICRTI